MLAFNAEQPAPEQQQEAFVAFVSMWYWSSITVFFAHLTTHVVINVIYVWTTPDPLYGRFRRLLHSLQTSDTSEPYQEQKRAQRKALQ